MSLQEHRTLQVDDIKIRVGALDSEKPHLGYERSGCDLESGLHRQVCEHCGLPNCCYQCEDSVGFTNFVNAGCEYHDADPTGVVAGRLLSNGALGGVEALTLACAVAGIDVESPAFLEAVETALQELGDTDGSEDSEVQDTSG